MKFQPTAEQIARFAREDAEAARNQPPVRDYCEHDGKRLLWFKGSDIIVDGYVWADCYKLPIESDHKAITEHVQHLLGDVEIVFEEKLL